MPEILPRLAWDNALAAATLAASSAAPGHDAAFACDGTLYRTWQPVGPGPHTLVATWPGPRRLTAWCVYGHTLGDVGGSIACEVDLGAGWVPFAGGPARPSGRECVYRTADPVTARQARFIVTGEAPRIAVVFLGEDLILESGLRPGWADPQLGTTLDVAHATSRSGLALPTLVEDAFAEAKLTLADVSWAWAKAQWLPFKRHAQTGGFYLRWHDDEPPAYATQAQFEDDGFSQPGFVTVGCTCRLRVE